MSLFHVPNQINCILHSLSDTLLTSPSCIYAIIDFNYNKGSIGGAMESLGVNHRRGSSPIIKMKISRNAKADKLSTILTNKKLLQV